MTGTSTPAGRSTGASWSVLALVCACQFMVILDASIVNVALPSIRGDLGLSKDFSDDFLKKSAQIADAAFPVE